MRRPSPPRTRARVPPARAALLTPTRRRDARSGGCCLLALRPPGLSVERRWRAHDLETWAIHLGRRRQRGAGAAAIYTGADDCALKAWDARGDLGRPVFVNRREHAAGVTCIAGSPHDANVLVTGSYDEHVRVWDVRNPAVPVLRAAAPSADKVHCGGGVWRVKFHPADGALLLVACMHGGFRIMRVDAAGAADGEPAPARTLRHYERHASLAYGADWVQVRGGRGTGAGKGAGAATVVSTCSFYDRSLHVWEARL